MAEPRLHVQGLCVELGGHSLLDGVSFSIEAGRSLALVGESGCGKTLTGLALLGLLPEAARVTSGSIRLGERELIGASESQLREVRGRRASMVFQDPMTALNPVLRVGDQIAEPLELHLKHTCADARARAVELLREVGVPEPELRARQYPHQLSGGLRQRAMIALALACGPELLIADEPTTALDPSLQRHVLELIAHEQKSRQLAVLLISHDLAVVARATDEVAVMYGGRIVERASSAEIFRAPKHPYTRALIASIPAGPRANGPLATIPGQVPAPQDWPQGCRFRDRCSRATDACARVPALSADAHAVACFHSEAA